jgi:endonuclease/exonuclease/phosphatase (EEP) superfamily protein YafD
MSGLDTNNGYSLTAPNSALRGKDAGVRFRLSQLLISLAWLVTFALGTIAVLRIFYHDGEHVLIWINACTRYVYLPTYACLLVGVWKRRWRLALANMAIISCHLYWLAPDFLPDRRFESSPDASVADRGAVHSLRIFFANVRQLNSRHDELLQEIKEANPDVVVLVEFTGNWRVVFPRSPVMAAYRYGNSLNPLHEIGIFSKLPVTASTQDWIAGRCIDTAEIPVGSQTLRLVGLHAPRPMNIHDNDYEGYWRRVLPLLAGERHPVIVVGDFNATQYSRVYEQIKAGGLRSAHEDRGRGYATSWPNGQEWLPPIRIDQAFLSSDVACSSISEGKGVGSDHKPFILDVQIRDPS